jgi:peptide chain release factor 2
VRGVNYLCPPWKASKNSARGSSNYGGIFDIPTKEEELAVLERQASTQEFWNDATKAQKVQKQMKELKDWIEGWASVHREVEEAAGLAEMALEEKDEGMLADIEASAAGLEQRLTDIELKKMLGGEDDARPAILSITSGAGGTESQDWTRMLSEMYRRWMDKRGFKYEVLDEQLGEEAGIKGITMEVHGEFAYGYLKAENGVHRLVRISPFDANARRHTSFSSVHVYPELEDIEFDIKEDDIKVDTFRAGGAGGQHINKTDSAVRMTHIPTGIVVACQNERSQHKNRASAMKLLTSRVYQHIKEQEEAKRDSKKASKLKIEWGSQIRSYVLQPYQMVKDVRTDYETSDAQGVLNGDLDGFINAYLLALDEENRAG